MGGGLETGNFLATGILIGWPLVTLVLFLVLSMERAIIASLLGAYLLLPMNVGFDFKGIPTLDKTSIPNVSIFLLAFVMARPGAFRWPRNFLVNLLMACYAVSPFITCLTNGDAIQIGTVTLPGLTLYSAVSAAAGNAIELMPFIIGAGLLHTERAHREFLSLFVLAALFYTVPILLEVLKGPFLQIVIYHANPGTSWTQQMRNGGFRAMVFMGHGLLISTFLAMAVLAAIGLARGKGRIFGVPASICAAYLFAVLFLNKSLGALLLVMLVGALLFMFRSRRFVGIVLVFAMMVVSYPVVRVSAQGPINAIASLSSNISEDRTESFLFRLRNEDMLLNRAKERPLFGWGGFARNRVFFVTAWGQTVDRSVTDGAWIITLGTSGWFGYLTVFGLLCYPFLHLFRMRRQAISPASLAMAAMLILNLLDLIPNSSLRPVTWLIAGALAGLPRLSQARRSQTALAAPARGQPVSATT
ncbi:MAG: O-antigen ligase family protein [Sphingobium sp.]|nr:O-antigen ligase family protein [Sphingobium sp.]